MAKNDDPAAARRAQDVVGYVCQIFNGHQFGVSKPRILVHPQHLRFLE